MSRAFLSIRFQGRVHPILADVSVDPVIKALSDGPLSSAVQFAHPLVDGRVFYSLPHRLLTILEAKFGREKFDAELWELEQRLCTDKEKPTGIGGYVDGLPFMYGYLRELPPLQISEEDRMSVGWSVDIVEQLQTLAGVISSKLNLPIRGFCGWLLTNKRFLKEHDEILERWKGHLFDHGIPGSSLFGMKHHPQFESSANAGDYPDFIAGFSTFYQRWRLSYLQAPYLPCPIAPQFPAPLPSRNDPNIGMTSYVPDTIPLPERDALRNLMEGALQPETDSGHLAEWHKLIHSSSQAKKSIARYARVFVVQHFWSILHHRHPAAFRRKGDLLKEVLAEYLLGDNAAGKETIHGDLQLINRRLGTKWFASAVD